jgi:predicted acetyltransferase
MASTELTRIQAADHAEQGVLRNLLELYIHDLSESFPFVQLGADGRFGYPGLAAYWTEPAKRFAFLIKDGGKVAGFALVTVGSPAAHEPDVYDIAEFFVLRGYRRSGVGRRAALRLWQQLPGEWTVRCSESNPHALAFWSEVVAELGQGNAKTSSWSGKTSQFRVFRFTSPVVR